MDTHGLVLDSVFGIGEVFVVGYRCVEAADRADEEQMSFENYLMVLDAAAGSLGLGDLSAAAGDSIHWIRSALGRDGDSVALAWEEAAARVLRTTFATRKKTAMSLNGPCPSTSVVSEKSSFAIFPAEGLRRRCCYRRHPFDMLMYEGIDLTAIAASAERCNPSW